MPKVTPRRDVEMEALLAAWAEFEEPSAWRRSAKGNLWRTWDGRTLTIFQRDETFGWCIADDEGRQFSRERYEYESDAMSALGAAVGVG